MELYSWLCFRWSSNLTLFTNLSADPGRNAQQGMRGFVSAPAGELVCDVKQREGTRFMPTSPLWSLPGWVGDGSLLCHTREVHICHLSQVNQRNEAS